LSTIASAALALAMIGAFVLLIGGARILRRDSKRGTLMIVAALVLLANVLIVAL
jgi:hypothetical protein